MSLFPSPHSTRPPHSILSATLSAKTSQSLLAASNGKGKLGFSIDSIVGEKSPARGRSQSPLESSPRDRSPIYRARSPSPPEDFKRSPSPSASPPSPSLVRPIPTSLPGSPSPSPFVVPHPWFSLPPCLVLSWVAKQRSSCVT